MTLRVLGVDLASAAWRDNGTAVLTFERGGEWKSLAAGVARWPQSGRPNPHDLARAIDELATANGVAAVSIDGPQGWRDPAAPEGWGRRADREARTPGKMGPPRSCVPGTYIGWVSTSVEVFAALRSLAHVQLVNEAVDRLEPPRRGYYLVESFPTSTWRTAGIVPLPAKAKTHDTAPFADELERAFDLPPIGRVGHDDLQAIVAALPAAALLGAAARPVARGVPGWPVGAEWVEGLIFDAAPIRAPAPRRRLSPAAPLLVLVTGPPAAGKTTIARKLADALRLPLLAKDDIKETLYDTLGTRDRAWSRRLGAAAFELQARLAAELLSRSASVIVEGNFDRDYDLTARLPPHRAIQVYCTAPRETLLARYGTRTRHPGHQDRAVVDEWRRGDHDNRSYRLEIATTIELDTTAPVDVAALGTRIASSLRRS